MGTSSPVNISLGTEVPAIAFPSNGGIGDGLLCAMQRSAKSDSLTAIEGDGRNRVVNAAGSAPDVKNACGIQSWSGMIEHGTAGDSAKPDKTGYAGGCTEVRGKPLTPTWKEATTEEPTIAAFATGPKRSPVRVLRLRRPPVARWRRRVARGMRRPRAATAKNEENEEGKRR